MKDARAILDAAQTHIGTATVKVLPDLSEFQAIIDALPATGLVVTKTTTYVRDDDGFIASETTTTTVTKG